MSEALLELLAPHFEEVAAGKAKPNVQDPTTLKYLNRLSTLQLSALSTTEPQSLAQASHSNLLSIQALSTRSSKSVVKSIDELKGLQETLPELVDTTAKTRDGVSGLDQSVLRFAEKYSRSGENEVLDRRKKALLMSRNVDRLSDILELPSLLASTISTSAQQGSSGHMNYASALDLHAYIKRLHLTYPESSVLKSLYDAAEASMADMKTNLIASLRGPNVKLTAGMRTISWLRRIIPRLAAPAKEGLGHPGEGSFGALFLACRLSHLLTTLAALEPLRELANLETERRLAGSSAGGARSSRAGGQQTERYLKRFVEIFREQSFAAISLFKSVFPADDGGGDGGAGAADLGLPRLQGLEDGRAAAANPLLELPSALATFPAHLVDLLAETLRAYLPNVTDKASRESLLTQVLYCAGSLGRLGADFGMMLALLDEDEEGADEGGLDWASVMKKHRVLSGRLESLASRPGPKTGAPSNVKVGG